MQTKQVVRVKVTLVDGSAYVTNLLVGIGSRPEVERQIARYVWDNHDGALDWEWLM